MQIVLIWSSVRAIWVPGDSQEHYESLVEHLGEPDRFSINGKEFAFIPVDLQIIL